MIITISGFPGSGKSTVGEMLAEKLGYNFLSMGDLRGKIAIKHNLTIDQLNKIGESEDWTDKEADKELIRIGKQEDDYVIDTRLGFHFIPDSVKIFLGVDLETGAERIFNGPRRPDEKKYSSVGALKGELKQRIKSDKKRYKKWYGVDFTNKSNYDLIIDTTELTPEKVVEKILKHIQHKHNI
ncbi:AAA family ATPase [Candidatus Woesearchaeota archaeon]|nr:AAA family ATPase [Candidatus Woesearchaeota archaeon]